jgi:5-methylcytosine-specific restriction endonuclease McrA
VTRRKNCKRHFKNLWLGQMGKCEQCNEPEQFIWRKGGVSGYFPDGDLVQFVWLTSNLEIDHILPLHRGGSNEADNLQLLCVDCHKAKSAQERHEASRRRVAEAWA